MVLNGEWYKLRRKRTSRRCRREKVRKRGKNVRCGRQKTWLGELRKPTGRGRGKGVGLVLEEAEA